MVEFAACSECLTRKREQEIKRLGRIWVLCKIHCAGLTKRISFEDFCMRLAGECSLTFMTLLCGAGCFSKPVFVALSSEENKVKAMVSRNSTACILIHWRCSCWVFVQAKYLLFVPHKNDIVHSLKQQAPSWPYLLSDHHLRLLLTKLLPVNLISKQFRS